MKKLLLFTASVVFTLTGSLKAQTQLFYTDFATAPTDMASLVSTKDVTLANPTEGIGWSIQGHASNKLAKSTQVPFANGVATLSQAGRLGLGGAAGYLEVQNMQGPFVLDVYWGVAKDADKRSLILTIGSDEGQAFSPEAIETVYKTTISYTETSAVNVKVGCKGGGIYVYDVLIAADTGSSIENSSADKGAVISQSYYDLTGKQVSPETFGILIKKEVYENGSTETSKFLNNQN